MAFEYQPVWLIKAIVSLKSDIDVAWEISKTFPRTEDRSDDEAMVLFEEDMKRNPNLLDLINVEKVWAEPAEEYKRI